MKTRFRTGLFILVLLIILLITPATPGELKVLAAMSSHTAKPADSLIVKYKNTGLQSMSSDEFTDQVSAEIESRRKMKPGMELVKLKDKEKLQSVMEQIQADQDVEVVEINYYYHVLDEIDVPSDTAAAGTADFQLQTLPVVDPTVVNDTYYRNQWAWEAVNVPPAWNPLYYTPEPIVVAVIDTGIQADHEDLLNRIAAGGRNFVDISSPNNICDDNGHGTLVSGVIAAEANNSKGIAGIAGPMDINILPLKAAGALGDMTVANMIDAIDYAVTAQVDVINISFGGIEHSDDDVLLDASIQNAVNQGIVVVAAAGNYGDTVYAYDYVYPASCENVISVGSISTTGSVSWFSTRNNKVDFAAPGEYIYTTTNQSAYAYENGTSFSAPIISGIAALMKKVKPTLTPLEIFDLLRITATDIDPAGQDIYYGYGLVNAQSAIQSIVVPVTGITVDPVTAVINLGSTTTLSTVISPTNASNQEVTWTSSDPSVATVGDGTVTTVAKGETTITATTADGSKSASCLLTVYVVPIKTTAADDRVSMSAGNQSPAADNNSWLILVEDSTIKEEFSATDIQIEGLPAGLECTAQKEDDNHIRITISGSADPAITRPVTVVVTVKATAVTQPTGLVDSAGLNLIISPMEDCFIATAAFGSYLDPHVWVLRQFRDQVLLPNPIGKWLVQLYYRTSPPIANLISQNSGLRLMTRVALTPLIFAVEYPRPAGLIACLLVILILWKRKSGTVLKGFNRKFCARKKA